MLNDNIEVSKDLNVLELWEHLAERHLKYPNLVWEIENECSFSSYGYELSLVCVTKFQSSHWNCEYQEPDLTNF